MKNIAFTALAGALLSVSWIATANAETLSAKIMQDHPGVSGGQTANPTARPDSNAGGLQRKAMQDHSGTSGGRTVTPLANADTGSIKERITRQ